MYAVFGNPIAHSKSPEIYGLFANANGICSKYYLKLASLESFNGLLNQFFNDGGLGVNITAPFKERATLLCNRLTERAMIANSVNTIKKQKDGSLLGDNTDGIGLISDLVRLGWLSKKDGDNKIIGDVGNDMIPINKISILVIGAGGAAKGIVSGFLGISGCYIHIINRTLLNSQKLVYYFHSIGKQNISYIDIQDFFSNSDRYFKKYDLVINATSSSMNGPFLKLPSFLINQNTKCYDLCYQSEDTSFIKWCKECKSVCCSDGLGMLISQAAYSFYLWHDIFPCISSVFNYFNRTL